MVESASMACSSISSVDGSRCFVFHRHCRSASFGDDDGDGDGWTAVSSEVDATVVSSIIDYVSVLSLFSPLTEVLSSQKKIW